MAKKPIKYAVVDAFTESAFKGNPAAVCVLEEKRDECWLQSLAAEFNIPQTCYLARIESPAGVFGTVPRFRLRWFTPIAEVKLCGHATLAAAHFCFTSGLVNGNAVEFSTQSGILKAKKLSESGNTDAVSYENGEKGCKFLIELDFPVVPLSEFNSNELSLISKALGCASVVDIKQTTTENDILVVLPSTKEVTDLQPQFEEILKCPGRGVIITALAPPESGFDFFSRFFCPKFGINEDPVCGSAHCALAPYWSNKLGKSDLLAYAASQRSGIVKLRVDEQNSRVLLQGKAVTVMEGSLLV